MKQLVWVALAAVLLAGAWYWARATRESALRTARIDEEAEALIRMGRPAVEPLVKTLESKHSRVRADEARRPTRDGSAHAVSAPP